MIKRCSMNINYEYYRVFYYAAKYKSFTKAANVLFQNQPNITRIINKLEDAFGCKLFLRTHKGVKLTPEGEHLFAHVEIAHHQLQKAETELMNQSNLEFGTVTIAANETAIEVLLLETLRSFKKKYPSIRVNLMDESTPKGLDMLDRGTVDFVVATSPANITRSMQMTELATVENILVCGPAYKDLAKKKQHLLDITQYPMIMLERNTMSYAFFNQFFLNHGISLRVDTETTTINQVLPMVKYDLGLGFLPESFARPALAKREIFKIDLYEEIPKRSIVLVQDTRKPESMSAHALISEILAPVLQRNSENQA